MLKAEQFCEKDIYQSRLYIGEKHSDVLVIWSPLKTRSLRKLELCSSLNGQQFARHCNYREQSVSGSWDIVDEHHEFANCSAINRNCKGEQFQQYNIGKNKQRTKIKNRWQSAQLDELAITHEPCLLPTGLPFTRRCVYNAKDYGAAWEYNKDLENVRCLVGINENIITFDLYTLLNEAKNPPHGVDARSILSKLRNLLAKSGTVRIPADLEISTHILKTILSKNLNTLDLPHALDTVNLLMESPANVIRASHELQTPNSLINVLSDYLDAMALKTFEEHDCRLIPNGVYRHTTNLISVFFINTLCSNLSGIAIYSTLAHPSADMYYDANLHSYIRYLHMHESLDELTVDPHIQLIAYIPQTTWQTTIINNAANNKFDIIRISLYTNGNMFNGRGFQVDSNVISMSIPGYNGDLSEKIPFIVHYKKNDAESNPQCGAFLNNKWTRNSESKALQENLLLCETAHLRPLAAIRRVEDDITVAEIPAVLTIFGDSTVDFVSIVGCGLTLLGLLCLWTLALCCTHWRSRTSNQLLLNLSFVVTLIMVYFLIMNISSVWNVVVDINKNYHCVAMGAFLQYTILVLVLWMLFIVILQYQRYKTIVGVIRSSNFVAKYAMAAWGLPIIPVALLIAFDSKSVVKGIIIGFAEFKRGRTSIEDEPRSGRPKTATTTTEIVAKVRDMVLNDRRIKVHEIANVMGISNDRVHLILHEELQMKRLSARWVPHKSVLTMAKINEL
ncbi:uncharacterized protein LOC133333843 [Musca vetustissima]|uniref:uncharacterized protein LOC133333843 n=1 Tax=Musca vetustissima TaxID=27455 RepID=UPI002AB7C79E|nr:uncharacterized protein LOC133333843 [Musca vetustissima]